MKMDRITKLNRKIFILEFPLIIQRNSVFYLIKMLNIIFALSELSVL